MKAIVTDIIAFKDGEHVRRTDPRVFSRVD